MAFHFSLNFADLSKLTDRFRRPTLVRADIGFPMGAMGTDTALETADAALMDNDLRKIPTFIRLSQATHPVLVQNISLAVGIKALFSALALSGSGPMWMAVIANVGASLLVVFNAWRLLRKWRLVTVSRASTQS